MKTLTLKENKKIAKFKKIFFLLPGTIVFLGFHLLKSLRTKTPNRINVQNKGLTSKNLWSANWATSPTSLFLPFSVCKLINGNVGSPTLEDMFPFLDRKEFEENKI